ncbi:hypothetical protein [Leuconostoc gelidum]|uniref:hypothetical protein n=1 Tax=Leuconostoc gelidum TaxID=1244 RepID=UPI001CC7B7E3|nr:hypothetical protein [Leuconostoc gelidum]MBZ5985970.1 hypothetical protein [Leuconostoc gelidum subsp. gelidum]
MRKAIQVTNQLDVEELNKLFEQGYTVESVDDNGVYILECTMRKLKAEPIKRKAIDHDISTNITLDKKQPNVRIEFDDIHDVPKVWVDGEFIGEVNGKPLVSLKVNWQTDTDVETHKAFDINYLDLTGNV